MERGLWWQWIWDEILIPSNHLVTCICPIYERKCYGKRHWFDGRIAILYEGRFHCRSHSGFDVGATVLGFCLVGGTTYPCRSLFFLRSRGDLCNAGCPSTTSSGTNRSDQSIDGLSLRCSKSVRGWGAFSWCIYFGVVGGPGKSAPWNSALWICGGLHVS